MQCERLTVGPLRLSLAPPCCACGQGPSSKTETALVPCNVRRFQHELFAVWRCSGCGSIHSLEQVDLSPYYAAYPFCNRRLDAWTRAVFGSLLARLKKVGLISNSRFLDYGCGAGAFLHFMRESGYRNCAGFDAYSANFSDEAVLQADYDIILAQDTIEHVQDPAGTLSRLAHLLRAGGIVCIGTPNADWIDFSRIGCSIHSLHQPYHLHIFSQRALLHMAECAGLAAVHVDTRSYCDTWLPGVNWTFLLHYLRALDNTLDAGFEPARPGLVLRSPQLLFLALCGWFFPVRSEMTVMFRKR